jgi:hypothetical protein
MGFDPRFGDAIDDLFTLGIPDGPVWLLAAELGQHHAHGRMRDALLRMPLECPRGELHRGQAVQQSRHLVEREAVL